jgi:hypothetical protein
MFDDFQHEQGPIPDNLNSLDGGCDDSWTDTIFHARITVTISVVDEARSIEVPLGAYRAGRWEAIPKLEHVFEFSPDALADDLTDDNLLNDMLRMSRDQILKHIEYTKARCEALTEVACLLAQSSES